MNCEQMTGLMSAWLDGELSEQETQQLQEHLERCDGCRTLFAQLQTLHASFTDLEEIPAPEHFARKVMARVEEQSKPKIVPLFKRPQVRALTGLAACALLCIGLMRVGLDGPAVRGAAEAAPAAAAPEASEPAAAPESYMLQEAPAELERAAEPAETAEMKDSMNFSVSGDMEPAQTPAAAAPEAPAAQTQQQTYRVVMSALPADMPELKELEWEEHTETGAACARLTREQAERLVSLADAQGLHIEELILPDEGEKAEFILLILM